jgi:hypothetical protein
MRSIMFSFTHKDIILSIVRICRCESCHTQHNKLKCNKDSCIEKLSQCITYTHIHATCFGRARPSSGNCLPC